MPIVLNAPLQQMKKYYPLVPKPVGGAAAPPPDAAAAAAREPARKKRGVAELAAVAEVREEKIAEQEAELKEVQSAESQRVAAAAAPAPPAWVPVDISKRKAAVWKHGWFTEESLGPNGRHRKWCAIKPCSHSAFSAKTSNPNLEVRALPVACLLEYWCLGSRSRQASTCLGGGRGRRTGQCHSGERTGSDHARTAHQGETRPILQIHGVVMPCACEWGRRFYHALVCVYRMIAFCGLPYTFFEKDGVRLFAEKGLQGMPCPVAATMRSKVTDLYAAGVKRMLEYMRVHALWIFFTVTSASSACQVS